jgi:hypothetical protein
MQTFTPKLTKLTKTAKIQVIKDAIREGNFDRDEMCIVLGVKDRQVRRYLNEIAKQDSQTNPDGTHILRALCLNSLTKKAALGKLSVTSEVAIVLAGESKKVELKEERTETKTVTYKLSYSEEDKTAILNAYGRINKQNRSPPQPPSLH